MQVVEQNQQLYVHLGAFLRRFRAWWAVAALAAVFTLAGIACVRAYTKLSHVVDARLARGPFAGTMNIYAAPERLAAGDPATAETTAARLVRALMRGTCRQLAWSRS